MAAGAIADAVRTYWPHTDAALRACPRLAVPVLFRQRTVVLALAVPVSLRGTASADAALLLRRTSGKYDPLALLPLDSCFVYARTLQPVDQAWLASPSATSTPAFPRLQATTAPTPAEAAPSTAGKPSQAQKPSQPQTLSTAEKPSQAHKPSQAQKVPTAGKRVADSGSWATVAVGPTAGATSAVATSAAVASAAVAPSSSSPQQETATPSAEAAPQPAAAAAGDVVPTSREAGWPTLSAVEQGNAARGARAGGEVGGHRGTPSFPSIGDVDLSQKPKTRPLVRMKSAPGARPIGEERYTGTVQMWMPHGSHGWITPDVPLSDSEQEHLFAFFQNVVYEDDHHTVLPAGTPVEYCLAKDERKRKEKEKYVAVKVTGPNAAPLKGLRREKRPDDQAASSGGRRRNRGRGGGSDHGSDRGRGGRSGGSGEKKKKNNKDTTDRVFHGVIDSWTSRGYGFVSLPSVTEADLPNTSHLPPESREAALENFRSDLSAERVKLYVHNQDVAMDTSVATRDTPGVTFRVGEPIQCRIRLHEGRVVRFRAVGVRPEGGKGKLTPIIVEDPEGARGGRGRGGRGGAGGGGGGASGEKKGSDSGRANGSQRSRRRGGGGADGQRGEKGGRSRGRPREKSEGPEGWTTA